MWSDGRALREADVACRLSVCDSLSPARSRTRALCSLSGPLPSHARSLEWPGGGSPGGRGSQGGSDGGSVKGPCGLMDKALVFGTKDCRLESCQGHICYWHRAAHHRRRIGFSLASRASGRGKRADDGQRATPLAWGEEAARQNGTMPRAARAVRAVCAQIGARWIGQSARLPSARSALGSGMPARYAAPQWNAKKRHRKPAGKRKS